MKMVYAFKLCLSKRLSNHNCRDVMSEGFFFPCHIVFCIETVSGKLDTLYGQRTLSRRGSAATS